MRILLQRVSRAEVRIDRERVAGIGRGLLLLVGFCRGDGGVGVAKAAARVVDLRIFQDDGGKMNLSLRDVQGEVLAVSQFTLYGETTKGRRPSFTEAAPPEEAEPLFQAFVEAVRVEGVPVQCGVFGAKMEVDLVNDGPVTLWMDLVPARE